MTDIEAMKKGYEYIRDRKKAYKRGLYECNEYINDCIGYINCLCNLELITSSEWGALYDFIMDDTEIDVDIKIKIKKY